MFFYVQGPNKHDLMPLERIFDRREVKKTEAIDKTLPIDTGEIHADSSNAQWSHTAEYVYQSINKLHEDEFAVFAYQIMSSPVETITSAMTLDQVLALLQENPYRHLPVVSESKKVIGIVSDRDILQYMMSVQQRYKENSVSHYRSIKVELLMQSPVLTASEQTDVRYIARLFFEKRVGAMPIVVDGELKGIITRSDILHAVMSHYEIELWI